VCVPVFKMAEVGAPPRTAHSRMAVVPRAISTCHLGLSGGTTIYSGAAILIDAPVEPPARAYVAFEVWSRPVSRRPMDDVFFCFVSARKSSGLGYAFSPCMRRKPTHFGSKKTEDRP
jgi:hypothetical protein